MENWQPDHLGPRYESLTIPLTDDSEGEVVATLVRSLPEREAFMHRLWGNTRVFDHVDVLYVHGWSDYFFNTELAEFWTERGARFFALDLRKYGRSLRDWHTPGYIEDLSVYDEELLRAVYIIDDSAPGAQPRTLVLLGHSTGGLILTLFAARNPGVCQAIVLNSPWIEFQLTGTVRKMLAPVIELGARIDALDTAPQLDMGYYTRAQRQVAPGGTPTPVNSSWRPDHAMPVRNGWMKAIIDGQKRIGGSRVDTPVCVLLSERWLAPTKWSEELTRVDSVINVDAVADASLRLSHSVTINWLEDALHDVFLSAAAPRAEAYRRLEMWMRGFLAAEAALPHRD